MYQICESGLAPVGMDYFWIGTTMLVQHWIARGIFTELAGFLGTHGMPVAFRFLDWSVVQWHFRYLGIA